MNPYLLLLKNNAQFSDDPPTKPSEAPFVGFVGDTPKESVNFFHDSYAGFNANEAAANAGEFEQLQTFWSNFVDRINWCDFLIHELCDVRGDDQARRDDLILTRQRMAPTHLDTDVRYLLDEIERVTPTSLPEPIRDCRDCEHHRGRNDNAIRYCVSPDGAAQRDGALSNVIQDCNIAARCEAFKRPAA